MKARLTFLAVAAVLLAAGAALAGDIHEKYGDHSVFELSPYAGTTVWSDDIGLDDDLLFGGRAAVRFLPFFALEGTYGYTSTNLAGNDAADVDVHHIGIDAVFDLRPSATVNPYLTAGWAQLRLADDPRAGRDIKPHGWEAGAGVKIRLGGDAVNNRSLRLDVRDVMTDLVGGMPNHGDVTHNWLVSAGLTFGFGRGSRDSDGDGVRDRDDACPGTPAGATVDARGCPADSDGDGVYDGLDQCPDTPRGATVDARGCPSDSDGDGVYDGLDQCPDTPRGAAVNDAGCPQDSDGDGVYDGLDECPDTPANLQVDESGCPIVVDEVQEELLDMGTLRTSDIRFKTGSAELQDQSLEILDRIGKTLQDWPMLRLEVGGHTDSQGSAEFNRKLSQARAEAVRDYILKHFPDVDPSRLTAVGYGESQPVADNGTAAGRAQNRRVEFKVLNPDEVRKVIRTRRTLQR